MDNQHINTSGQGKDAVVPDEVRWFNWGAQFYRNAWATQNGVGLYDYVTKSAVNTFNILFWGQKGNELAWRAKKWESVESFNEIQRKWSTKGKTAYLAVVFISVVMIIGGLVLYNYLHS